MASGGLAGKLLDGRYRILRELGRGGMATVYLARQESLNRDVVIKIPSSAFLEDEGFRKRFSREIGSMVRLPHPNVVGVLDAGEFDSTPYAVIEYLEGGSLKDRQETDRARASPGRWAGILSWLVPIANALDYIHGHGVVHRDVKPANILFDKAGNPFLSDFGIAKALGAGDTHLTMTGATPGTPVYMAPESGEELTGASDQYALAVIVYEALSGTIPHDGETPWQLLARKLTQEAPPIKERVPDLPAPAAEAVMRALSKDPARRFPSCLSFVRAFEAGLGGQAGPEPVLEDAEEAARRVVPNSFPLGPRDRTRSIAGSARRGLRHRRVLMLVAAGAALAVAAVGEYFLLRVNPDVMFGGNRGD